MNENNEFVIELVGERDPELAVKLTAYDREFSPEEAMCLIHNSYAAIAEKHKAYKKLISIYPNHVLEWKEGRSEKPTTLSSFLTAYIDSENMLIEKCKSDDVGAFYELDTYCTDGLWDSQKTGGVILRFHSYQEAIDYCTSDYHSPTVALFKIGKGFDKSSKSYITLRLTPPDMSIISVKSENVIPESDVFYKFTCLKTALPELQ